MRIRHQFYFRMRGFALPPLVASNNGSYLLNLDDSLAWCLVGDSGTSSWLRQLASIMALKSAKSGHFRKLSFVQHTNGAPGFQVSNTLQPPLKAPDLPDDGWRMQNLPALRVWSHSDSPDIVCELSNTASHGLAIFTMGQALFPIYEAVIDRGGVPFHAALLECNGKGILVAGRGGKGKTTCCKLAPRHWKALCDDETLVVRSGSRLYNAHPFPTWSDYLLRRSERTWNVQRSTQISAIFFLEQGESDRVSPLGEAETAAKITQSAGQVCARMWGRLESWVRRENNVKLFANACDVAKNIPAFSLHASLTGRFWESIEEVLE